MQANLSRTRIWRSQYLQSIELVHGVSKCYSLPRHFHEELELNIKQGDGWQFNYRFNQLIMDITVIFPLIALAYYLENRALQKADS